MIMERIYALPSDPNVTSTLSDYGALCIDELSVGVVKWRRESGRDPLTRPKKYGGCQTMSEERVALRK